MKYSRGRIIALTILSVTIALALFGAGLFYNFRDTIPNIAAEVSQPSPNVAPGFDKLYQRIPFSTSDTGTTDLGQRTKFTLIEESYKRGALTEFLDASPANSRSYRDLQTRRREGYPYPVFTDTDMRSIAKGLGDTLEIPVVMLDHNYDDIVLFELTNLDDLPAGLVIKRDGVEYVTDKQIIRINDDYNENQVYRGVANNLYESTPYEVYDTDGTTLLLTVTFVRTSSTGYDVSYDVIIKDPDGNYFRASNGSNIQKILGGNTELYNGNNELVYHVQRENNSVKIYNPANQQIGETITVNEIPKYEIGAVAYNSKAVRGMFREEGLYEISFSQRVAMGDGIYTSINVSFAFIIVNKNNYKDDFPRFNTDNRATGYAEIYNYSYESEYPVVNYYKYRFDVKVNHTAEYIKNISDYNSNCELIFYNIGEYQMVSALQYYSQYLYDNSHISDPNQEILPRLAKRGVNEGYITLKRYTTYSSVLNIFGFQAYYGGQHSISKYNGPLPFFDSINADVSSDISAWVRDENMTAGKNGSGVNLSNMNVSNALHYSSVLANYITEYRTNAPVRTNFPPVVIYGNVPYATGKGTSGEAEVVLSTVAYRPFYGTENTLEWQSRTLEVGEPFEDAGDYVVIIYFKVNEQMCQQTFYFQIVNSIEIAFEVTQNNLTRTYYAGELELNQAITGQQVRMTFAGKSTFGPFEVMPTIELDYAEFGKLIYQNQTMNNGNDGSFEFRLSRTGQYRLTVKYGAHRKSTSEFNIIVDNTAATGVKAVTKTKSLALNANLAKKVAIVGAGKVNLTWDRKLSGIDFNNVHCDFFEMVRDQSGEPNTNIDFSRLSEDDLFSSYTFMQSKYSQNYIPVKTESGWALSETFEIAGLYKFTIYDVFGNETQYVLIIDNSTPTFVQNQQKNQNTASNAVTFDENVGVRIGFGTRKKIKDFDTQFTNAGNAYQDIFDTLGDAEILTSSGDLRIPLAKVEYSNSGAAYQDVGNDAYSNGYIVLRQEGTFYFRATDVLGNIGEYYIVLTHDNCFGMVYADANSVTMSSDGKISDQPNEYTSLVTSNGGMTNRPYVSFSFLQSAAAHVSKIYLQFYPLNYDINSNNYPFAKAPENCPKENGIPLIACQDDDGLIYYSGDYDASDNGKTIRLALFNIGKTTPSGMYIITRQYTSQPSGGDSSGRDYYFIVDRQKMLYYAEGEYETSLKVNFAQGEGYQSKTATAAVINNSRNILSSNRTAWINGFKNKYAWKHKTINYNISYNIDNLAFKINGASGSNYPFKFPSLTPRFSYVDNKQNVIWGEGEINWSIAEPGTYQLLIYDNARNISCRQINGNIVELKDGNDNAPTSANWDYLTLNIETNNGTKAEFVVGDNNVISNSRMQQNGNNYVYIVDPTDMEHLLFRFKSDPQSMYADVDVASTMASWIWRTADGKTRSVYIDTPTADNGMYTIDLMEYLGNVIIPNGSSLSVSIKTFDNVQTVYTVLFDLSDPSYNLRRVKNNDNLARDLTDSEIAGVANGYIYGLSSDFVFERDTLNNPYLDTMIITYREVNYAGTDGSDAIPFKLYNGVGEAVPFATLVGLRDNEMKYYYITETDYAGHSTEYRVQIKGSNYTNSIAFIGAISEEDDEIQIGVEMRASTSSVHQFFLYNRAFRFESGDEYYMALGNQARWYIDGVYGSGDNREEFLITILNDWVNAATDRGVKCSCKLYDRIGDVEVFEFYNIREDATQIQLDCFTTNRGISLEVTNLDNLPRILLSDNLASLFEIEIEDKNTNSFITGYEFSIYGIMIDTTYITHELVIRVTDPFGRVSTTEYHQQSQGSIIFNTYGNTVLRDGIIYVGDDRGVDFSYMREVYTVLVYDTATGQVLNNLQTIVTTNGMVRYTFRPDVDSNTIQTYHIVARGVASGAVLFDKTFALDTRLPEVTWKNASEQTIEVEGQSFVSAVNLNISESATTSLFNTTISYTRSLDGHSEAVTLQPGTKKATFHLEGSYEVTLRNTIWAKKIYRFEIVRLSDTLVLVYDDGEQLQPSPSNYKYSVNGKDTYITRYVFTTTNEMKQVDANNQVPYGINEYEAHGLKVVPGQTNRVLAGYHDADPKYSTDYYFFDGAKTLVWRLALAVGKDQNDEPIYTNPIYIATTGVSAGKLNEINRNNNRDPLSLELNGDPNNLSSNKSTVSTSATYNIIYSDFINETRQNIKVKLTYPHNGVDIVFDKSGAPCYQTEGNLIVVDCYHNGNLVQTLNYDDEFVINRDDAGYYEFYVHDLVGNHLYFGNENLDEDDINYQQDHYTLVVMTKPVVTINDQRPVNNMIYNDRVELRLVDYGNEFLSKYYQSLLTAGNNVDSNFFKEYFCVTNVEVTHVGADGKETTTKGKDENINSQTSFIYNQSGSYHVSLTYHIYRERSGENGEISGEISGDLHGDYYFRIVQSKTVKESFSMPLYSDISVLSIKRDGYQVPDYRVYVVSERDVEYLTFNAENNSGSYVITLQSYDSVLRKSIEHEVCFNIQHKANSASTYFVSSSASGEPTTGSVAIYYNPYWLYLAQGDVKITLVKNYVEIQEEKIVDSSIISTDNYNSQLLFTLAETGTYSVIVSDADGDTIYFGCWLIEQEQSPFGYIVLAVVLGLAAIGILVFMRMRNKMTIK